MEFMLTIMQILMTVAEQPHLGTIINFQRVIFIHLATGGMKDVADFVICKGWQ
jgi:hypothetical protein